MKKTSPGRNSLLPSKLSYGGSSWSRVRWGLQIPEIPHSTLAVMNQNKK